MRSWPVTVVLAVQAAVLLAMAPFYGPHRDELYFAAAGQHLAWGYADQPALVPLLARVADLVAPGSLVALRVAPLLAAVALTWLTAWFAASLGGGRSAQVLAAVLTASGAAVLALGHRLSTATFDALAWTAVLVLVARALRDGRPRWWLLAGLVAGVGLHAKHGVALLLLAVLVATALDRDARRHLRTAWPWVGGLVALAVWSPNLVWQASHGWPVLELSADIADEYGGVDGRLALVAQLVVLFSPLTALVWGAGLVALLRRPAWRPVRPVGLAFLVVLGLFLLSGGKGYYLAGAVPPLLAAGCVVVTERWSARLLVVAGAVVVASSAVAWPGLVPVLPADTYAASPYPGLDDSQRETVGWPDHVARVREVVDTLPPAQRRTAVAVGQNYGEAGALEWYGVGLPVYSGHNGYQEWGPPPEAAAPVVVVGHRDPGTWFTGCAREATLGLDGKQADLDQEERGAGVWVCDRPRDSWAEVWPRLSYYAA